MHHIVLEIVLRAVLNKRPKNSTQADRKTERIRDGWTDRGQFIGPTFKVSRSKNRAIIHLKGTEKCFKKAPKVS